MKKVHADIFKLRALADDFEKYFPARAYADRIDTLIARARLLEGKDRAIMVMYLDKGNSVIQIARVAGVSQGAISKRIRKILTKLIDGEFILCLQHAEHFEHIEISVAKDYFLVGRSQIAIAESRNISIYMVRKIIAKITEFKKKNSKRRSRNV